MVDYWDFSPEFTRLIRQARIGINCGQLVAAQRLRERAREQFPREWKDMEAGIAKGEITEAEIIS